MADPDFGQRQTELRRALAGNRSLLVLLLAGLVLVGAFAFSPCALSQGGPTLVAVPVGPGYSAELITAGLPSHGH
jgi:hypothetical protein